MKYLLIAFIFIACTGGSNKNSLKISTEILDTIKSSPKVVATPALLETAFINGTTQKTKDLTLNLYGVTIGKIKVTSGRIVACDPLHIDEYGIPFTQLFPTGEFPVQLSVAKLGHGEMVAFARINFSDEPVAKWELALLEGQTPLPVESQEIHGYGVDGGIGIFMDAAAIKDLSQEQLTQVEEGIYRDVLKEMDKHYRNDWKYAMFNFGNHNMAAYTTGFGDGRYASYIGFNAEGKLCRLVSDFKLFDWKQGNK